MTTFLRLTLCLLILFFTTPAWAATHIAGGTIESSQTWTAAGSPYILDRGVIIAYGTTLTIEPGVRVELNYKQLNTRGGTITATGTTFTSDGSTSMFVQGYEKNDVVYNGRFSFAECTFEYDAKITIKVDSTVSTADDTGATLDIYHCDFEGPHAITAYDHNTVTVNIRNTHFQGEAGRITIDPLVNGTFSGNVFEGQVVINGDALNVTNNTFLLGTIFLDNLGYSDRTLAITNGVSRYQLLSSIEAKHGNTLTIEPGVRVELNYKQLNTWGGNIEATGAIFTSTGSTRMAVRGRDYNNIAYNGAMILEDCVFLYDAPITIYVGSSLSSSSGTTALLTINGCDFQGPHSIIVRDDNPTSINIDDSTFRGGDGEIFINGTLASGVIENSVIAWDVNYLSHYIIMSNNTYGFGNLTVRIEPPAAVSAGVKWRLRENGATSINSGNTFNDLPEGTYTVHFEAVDGYAVPPDYQVEVTAGNTTTYTGTCSEDPIGADPILERDDCVGFSRNFYIFELAAMPDDEAENTNLDSLGHQIGNLAFNIFKDVASPASILVSIATGGVSTWINTTLNLAQLVGLSEQAQLVLLDENGASYGYDGTVKPGEAVMPTIFIKTGASGVLDHYRMHCYTKYENNLINDDYEDKFTLLTNDPVTKAKPYTLYMLLPRTTSLRSAGDGYTVTQRSRGIEGFFFEADAGSPYLLQMVTNLLTPPLGLSEYLIKVDQALIIAPYYMLLLQ